MGVTDGVGCLICHDSAQCSPFKLTCGHAFGRSCMQRWMESSGLKNCLLCTKQLSHDEVKKINDIPLCDRVVNISTTALPIFGKTALFFFCTCGAGVAFDVICEGSLTTSLVTYTAESTAAFFPAATIGALGAAAGIPEHFAAAAGAATGAAAGASPLRGANVGAAAVAVAYLAKK